MWDEIWVEIFGRIWGILSDHPFVATFLATILLCVIIDAIRPERTYYEKTLDSGLRVIGDDKEWTMTTDEEALAINIYLNGKHMTEAEKKIEFTGRDYPLLWFDLSLDRSWETDIPPSRYDWVCISCRKPPKSVDGKVWCEVCQKLLY